jgi:hypothetical protein
MATVSGKYAAQSTQQARAGLSSPLQEEKVSVLDLRHEKNEMAVSEV